MLKTVAVKRFYINGGILTTRRQPTHIPPWIGVGLIIIAMLFLGALLRYQLRLVIFGTPAIGEVVAFDEMSNGRRSKPRVRVMLANGEAIEFNGASLKNVPIKIGDVVPVYYLPDDPTFGEIATFRRFWLGLIIGSMLSIVLFSSGLWVLRTPINT